MNWQVEWLDEAKKDMRKLGKAEQIQVLKGIEKVRTNPLPTSQGGYGKPLRNAERTKLSRLCKIKFRDIGIRVVYKPLLRNGIMTIIVVGIRSDSDAYIKANKETQRIWTIRCVRQFSANVTFSSRLADDFTKEVTIVA